MPSCLGVAVVLGAVGAASATPLLVPSPSDAACDAICLNETDKNLDTIPPTIWNGCYSASELELIGGFSRTGSKQYAAQCHACPS
jgi:hypothetical protein